MLLYVILFQSVSLAVVIEFSSLVLVKLKVCQFLHTQAERVFTLHSHLEFSSRTRARDREEPEEMRREWQKAAQAAKRHVCCYKPTHSDVLLGLSKHAHTKGFSITKTLVMSDERNHTHMHWRDERSNTIHLINNNWETQSNKTTDSQIWGDYWLQITWWTLVSNVIRMNHFR